MLRKAEQVVALCHIEYYLEENCVGHAISRYEAWQKSFPQGINSDRTPLTLQEVCRISDAEFCCMPWIYANVLQELCAEEEPEEDEITAKTELNYMANLSNATWIWQDSSSYSSFNHAYTGFMSTAWVQEFVNNMEIPWPLTPAWNAWNASNALNDSKEMTGEVIWPGEEKVLTPKFKPIPYIPASPKVTFVEAPEPLIEAPEVPLIEAPEVPVIEAPEPLIEAPEVPLIEATPVQKPKSPPKVRDAELWPFMRCKNIYKAYGGTCRMSHHDLLISLANKFDTTVEILKKTDPYTMNIRGLPKLLKRGYY